MTSIKINFNTPQIKEKVTNDKFGMAVSVEWKRLINPYTPRDTGKLMDNTGYKPFKIEYLETYSAPVYNSSGWEFKRKNPYSTDHWDIKAAEAGQRDKLYQTLNRKLKNNEI